MQISVIATLCHTLSGITAPVCHEVIVLKDEMPMQACMLSQPALAEWKANSIYSGAQWTLAGYKCAFGDYVLKDQA